MIDPVLDMLSHLRARPAMYIGSNSLDALFLYLNGYTAALQDHTDVDLSGYGAFIDGLYGKYGRGGGGHSWAWVLNGVAGSQDGGVTLFFNELDDFNRGRKA